MNIFSKIKSYDNSLMNIHELMNSKVAAILPYGNPWYIFFSNPNELAYLNW